MVVTVAGFGGGGVTNTGFQVTFAGTQAATNLPFPACGHERYCGHIGLRRRDRQGRRRRQQGRHHHADREHLAGGHRSRRLLHPVADAVRPDRQRDRRSGRPLIYSWEQNDRGGAAGTAVLNNTKTNGPLFAMFPYSGQISASDTLLYHSPGENHLTDNPTRIFPDMAQIAANNTMRIRASARRADAGPVPVAITECYAEFLPTRRLRRVRGHQRGAAVAPLPAHRPRQPRRRQQ